MTPSTPFFYVLFVIFSKFSRGNMLTDYFFLRFIRVGFRVAPLGYSRLGPVVTLNLKRADGSWVG
ncbi:hypothetical protein HanPSC8_Chr01g0023681 [Helianthus annuus]|nr:hypothetical protein HanPSC8_Chr01g0023681 [Helianthus annuus]